MEKKWKIEDRGEKIEDRRVKKVLVVLVMQRGMKKKKEA